MEKPTLTHRLDTAKECRKCGRNCAQAVLLACADLSGLDNDTAARISNALGSGVAATGEICGVANAIAIVAGMQCNSNPESKATATKIAKPLVEQFAEMNDGKLRCADLKFPGAPKSCEQLIAEGIEILHNSLSN